MGGSIVMERKGQESLAWLGCPDVCDPEAGDIVTNGVT